VIKEKYPIVEVEWTDAAADIGWKMLDDYKGDIHQHPCFSVGFLFEKGKGGVKLLQTANPYDGTGTELLFVPKGMIKRVRIIRRAKPWPSLPKRTTEEWERPSSRLRPRCNIIIGNTRSSGSTVVRSAKTPGGSGSPRCCGPC
jgi:hypothetical protein